MWRLLTPIRKLVGVRSSLLEEYMATKKTTFSAEEWQVVDRFAAGHSVHAIAKSSHLTVQTVERLIRRALGHPAHGTR